MRRSPFTKIFLVSALCLFAGTLIAFAREEGAAYPKPDQAMKRPGLDEDGGPARNWDNGPARGGEEDVPANRPGRKFQRFLKNHPQAAERMRERMKERFRDRCPRAEQRMERFKEKHPKAAERARERFRDRARDQVRERMKDRSGKPDEGARAQGRRPMTGTWREHVQWLLDRVRRLEDRLERWLERGA
jgi:hypothetical protein